MKKKTETIYEYKVESEKNDVDENQLYKLIAFYKLIKLERNLFNHMDNGNVVKAFLEEQKEDESLIKNVDYLPETPVQNESSHDASAPEAASPSA